MLQMQNVAKRCKSGSGITCFCKRNNLLDHFSITIHLHLASFYAQNTSKKTARKMLSEQFIEFELRGPEFPCRTCKLLL